MDELSSPTHEGASVGVHLMEIRIQYVFKRINFRIFFYFLFILEWNWVVVNRKKIFFHCWQKQDSPSQIVTKSRKHIIHFIFSNITVLFSVDLGLEDIVRNIYTAHCLFPIVSLLESHAKNKLIGWGVGWGGKKRKKEGGHCDFQFA